MDVSLKISVSDSIRTVTEEHFYDQAIGTSRSSKHDSYVDVLHDEIKDFYDETLTHYTFFNRKGKRQITKGEVDLIAFKGDSIHIFEVKCSNRITKARQQLRKIKRILSYEFSGFAEIKIFFYCGSSGILRAID